MSQMSHLSQMLKGIDTSQSPLNNSLAKQQYTFSKEKRFFSTQDRLHQSQVFYELPSSRSKRSTTFGFGQKYDISKQATITPAPTAYNKKTDFDVTQFKGQKGIQFGLGRSNVRFFSPFEQRQSSPGPGKYNYKFSTISDIKYSMRIKPNLPEERFSNKFSPGPNRYQLDTITGLSSKGNYQLSIYKSYGTPIFHPTGKFDNRSLINLQKINQIPGPSKYQIGGDIDPKGQYFNQKYKNSCARKFSQAKRITVLTNKNSPGVGSYKLPSEFPFLQQLPKFKKQIK